jgi:glycosyl transferase family 87
MFVVGSIPALGRVMSADRHWIRTAAFLWIGMTIGLAVYAYLRPNSHTVYDIYLTAARRWLTGDDIYVRTREYYRYSPLFAVSLVPLAILPDSLSAAAWKLINCGIFAIGLGAWARRLIPEKLNHAEIAAIFLLAAPLSLHSMYNSQANLMMLGSALLGLAAAAEGRWNRAAAWLAWATLIKGYPLALAMLVAGIYPRQFTLKYVAAMGLGLLLPFLTQNPELVQAQYASWFAHLMDSTAIMRERMRTIDQLFVIYGQPLSPQAFAVVEALAGAAVFGVCLWIARQTADARMRLTRVFEWFALWVVLFGPATESCTYVVAAPVVAWRLLESLQTPRSLLQPAALLASLLMMGPAVTDMFGRLIRNFANEHGSQPIGALLLLACLLYETIRANREQSPARDAAGAMVLPIPAEDVAIADGGFTRAANLRRAA